MIILHVILVLISCECEVKPLVLVYLFYFISAFVCNSLCSDKLGKTRGIWKWVNCERQG